MKLTLAKILQIGREVLQGVQETTMKVSRSSSKACSRDLIIFSDYKKKALPCSLEGKKKHGSFNKPISNGVSSLCKPDP